MNPSPVTTTPLPEAAGWFRENPAVRKVLMSDHLVAALVKSKDIYGSKTTKVIISTRGQPWDITRCSTTEWAAPEDSCVIDIALFKAKLYVLLDTVLFDTEDEEYGQVHELRVLDDGHEQTTIQGTPVAGFEDDFDPYETDAYGQRHYLVVSGDRLLMVQRWINLPPIFPIDSGIEKRTRLFKVFEATGLSSGCGQWTEVDRLTGRALFVSEGCSESLPAGGQSSGVGVREDCIYFLNDETCENPFPDSGAYNMRDQTVAPLLPATVAVPAAGYELESADLHRQGVELLVHKQTHRSKEETVSPPTTCDISLAKGPEQQESTITSDETDNWKSVLRHICMLCWKCDEILKGFLLKHELLEDVNLISRNVVYDPVDLFFG
uniref:KIB1-4 beta-propeller domain-containing protein n=1 Tax=Aegilops tauschii TaxID=37682 RepID=M8ARW8_AEGTA